MTRWIVGLMMSAAMAFPALGQGLLVTARTYDDQRISLGDAAMGAGWKLTGKQEGSAVEFAGMDLVSIAFADKPFPSKPKGPYLRFPTGETLCADILGSDDEKVRARNPILGEFTVPLSAIEAVVMDVELADEVAGLVRRAADRHGDEVLLKSRDFVSGTVTGMQSDKVLLLREDQDVALDKARIAGIAFDPSLVDYELTPELFAQLRLSDGSVINATEVVSDGPKLSVKTCFGASLLLDAGDLVDLSFRNGRVSYLSDLEPSKQVHDPFLDDSHSLQRDRSALGDALRLGGRIYAKGLGVRSRSVLVYPLEGYVRFDADVGLDESAGPQASVRFQVLVDGELAFDSGEMVAASEPIPVQVPVKNARELTLLVEYESRGDVQDFANWCDARLSR